MTEYFGRLQYDISGFASLSIAGTLLKVSSNSENTFKQDLSSVLEIKHRDLGKMLFNVDLFGYTSLKITITLKHTQKKSTKCTNTHARTRIRKTKKQFGHLNCKWYPCDSMGRWELQSTVS